MHCQNLTKLSDRNSLRIWGQSSLFYIFICRLTLLNRMADILSGDEGNDHIEDDLCTVIGHNTTELNSNQRDTTSVRDIDNDTCLTGYQEGCEPDNATRFTGSDIANSSVDDFSLLTDTGDSAEHCEAISCARTAFHSESINAQSADSCTLDVASSELAADNKDNCNQSNHNSLSSSDGMDSFIVLDNQIPAHSQINGKGLETQHRHEIDNHEHGNQDFALENGDFVIRPSHASNLITPNERVINETDKKNVCENLPNTVNDPTTQGYSIASWNSLNLSSVESFVILNNDEAGESKDTHQYDVNILDGIDLETDAGKSSIEAIKEVWPTNRTDQETNSLVSAGEFECPTNEPMEVLLEHNISNSNTFDIPDRTRSEHESVNVMSNANSSQSLPEQLIFMPTTIPGEKSLSSVDSSKISAHIQRMASPSLTSSDPDSSHESRHEHLHATSQNACNFQSEQFNDSISPTENAIYNPTIKSETREVSFVDKNVQSGIVPSHSSLNAFDEAQKRDDLNDTEIEQNAAEDPPLNIEIHDDDGKLRNICTAGSECNTAGTDKDIHIPVLSDDVHDSSGTTDDTTSEEDNTIIDEHILPLNGAKSSRLNRSLSSDASSTTKLVTAEDNPKLTITDETSKEKNEYDSQITEEFMEIRFELLDDRDIKKAEYLTKRRHLSTILQDELGTSTTPHCEIANGSLCIKISNDPMTQSSTPKMVQDGVHRLIEEQIGKLTIYIVGIKKPKSYVASFINMEMDCIDISMDEEVEEVKGDDDTLQYESELVDFIVYTKVTVVGEQPHVELFIAKVIAKTNDECSITDNEGGDIKFHQLKMTETETRIVQHFEVNQSIEAKYRNVRVYVVNTTTVCLLGTEHAVICGYNYLSETWFIDEGIQCTRTVLDIDWHDKDRDSLTKYLELNVQKHCSTEQKWMLLIADLLPVTIVIYSRSPPELHRLRNHISILEYRTFEMRSKNMQPLCEEELVQFLKPFRTSATYSCSGGKVSVITDSDTMVSVKNEWSEMQRNIKAKPTTYRYLMRREHFEFLKDWSNIYSLAKAFSVQTDHDSVSRELMLTGKAVDVEQFQNEISNLTAGLKTKFFVLRSTSIDVLPHVMAELRSSIADHKCFLDICTDSQEGSEYQLNERHAQNVRDKERGGWYYIVTSVSTCSNIYQ